MGAKMIPRELYEQAGMEVPYNGKYSSAATTATNTNPLKEGMRQIFKDIDKQDAVNRYVWGNLPSGITGQLLEEVLYHRGQGAFFYLDTLNKFFFLPYALSAKDGTGLDPYGRFLNITPLPLAGGTVDKDGNAKPWLPGKVFDVAYDVILPEELTIDDLKNKAVLLQDYTPSALTRTCTPRATKQEEIIDVMADTVPLLRTAMVNGVGVVGVKIQSADEDVNIQMANYQVQNAAINGTRYIGLLTKLDMEEMANASGALDTENYMRALQSLDNLRGTYASIRAEYGRWRGRVSISRRPYKETNIL